jgi:hypothetical protein
MGRENAASVFAETSTGPGVKSLSCGITEANVQRSTRLRKAAARQALNPPLQGYGVAGVQRSMQNAGRDGGHHNLFFDEGNVAAAFHVAGPDIFELLGFRGQTQVFFDIVSGDVIPSHGAQNQITVFDD